MKTIFKHFQTIPIYVAVIFSLGTLPLGATSPLVAEKLWDESEPDLNTVKQVTLPSFVELAKKLKPVVVNISTTQKIKTQNPFFVPGPFQEFFNDPYNRRMFRPEIEREITSLGSGFIINKDGYIITNNHVVENQIKIRVKLIDDREFDAEVVGADKQSDVALIKIKGTSKIPFSSARLGDSDKVEVGEWVLAIGNPFQLGHTLTHGIVSALGRDLHMGVNDDFIQTDAAINPGNSGGPLFSMKGQVVGINTAIVQPSIANNTGFAVPINIAKEIIQQLLKTGTVVRGYLGILFQSITTAHQKALGLKSIFGALVADVMKDSPAEKAGIQRGDVIIEFDGKKISKATDLRKYVTKVTPNTSVRIVVLRDNKPRALKVTVGQRPDEETAMTQPDQPEAEEDIFGFVVQELTPSIAQSLGFNQQEKGVVIADLAEKATTLGLQQGDVIKRIIHNQQATEITGSATYKAAIKTIKKGDSVSILIKRSTGTFFVSIEVE